MENNNNISLTENTFRDSANTLLNESNSNASMSDRSSSSEEIIRPTSSTCSTCSSSCSRCDEMEKFSDIIDSQEKRIRILERKNHDLELEIKIIKEALGLLK